VSLSCNRACVYALKGEKEDALENLGKAIELDPKLKDMARDDEDFKGLRGDEGFKS
jgi:superkiller protein 3